MKYFVLNPKSTKQDDIHAAASRYAMYAYAAFIMKRDYEMGKQLESWADKEKQLAIDNYGFDEGW